MVKAKDVDVLIRMFAASLSPVPQPFAGILWFAAELRGNSLKV